ncbi:hypothetical protein K438DRAFT_2030000, partial [Mycena galopus ATCC 62051]
MEVDVHYRSSSRASVSSGRMTIPSSNVSDWDDFDDSETRAGVNALKTAQQPVPAVDKKMSSKTASHSSSAATAPIYLQQRRLPIHLRQRLLPFIFSSDDFPFIFGSDCSHLSSAATTSHSSSAAVRITDYCSANFGHTNIQFRLLPFIFSSDCSHLSSAIAFGHLACNVPPGIRMSRLPIRRRGSRQGSRPSSRHTLSRSETLLSLSP